MNLTTNERTDDDQEYTLIRQIAAGDREKFRFFVDHYKDMIFSLVMRQVNDRATAEELTQEIFVKAYLNLDKFRFESRFSTWLTRIALNHSNSYFASRTFKNRLRTESFSPEVHDSAGPELDTEDRQRQMMARFRDALAALKPAFREVLVLCALEGKSYAEAAGILEIPIGTIRSRLNKARLLLRENIVSSSLEGLSHES